MIDGRAQYVMIGGFLGAGKTTAVGRLARYLTDRGKRVGLITNDQSSGLVDTRMLRQGGFQVEEITGGCFCCRFSTLAEAAEKLEVDGRPDVILAEPVGSCTDLVATVSYPLRRIYGDRFRIAPLSVLLDPERVRRVLGLAAGRMFSDKVLYVFHKQLEEADLIVVNKVDSLQPTELAELLSALHNRYPSKQILAASAKDGAGVEAWFELLLGSESAQQATMELDYQTYAEGEALLGWYNATVQLQASERFDANRFLLDWTDAVRLDLAKQDAEIAHLKATLDADGQLAALSLVSTSGEPDLREAMLEGVLGGELILNLRAEAAPEVLAKAARQALEHCIAAHSGLTARRDHEEFFEPSPPQPTHRDAIES